MDIRVIPEKLGFISKVMYMILFKSLISELSKLNRLEGLYRRNKTNITTIRAVHFKYSKILYTLDNTPLHFEFKTLRRYLKRKIYTTGTILNGNT